MKSKLYISVIFGSISVSGKLVTHPLLGLGLGLELILILGRGGWTAYQKPGFNLIFCQMYK